MQRYLWLLILICAAPALNAQYIEFFPISGKGYNLNLVDDLTGVNWTLSPWALDAFNDDGRDASDYFNTTAAGKLEGIDFDQEVCWESPLINTTAAPTVSIKARLTWAGFDADVAGDPCVGDYIKVLYSVNGGAYVMVPNQVGGNACATIAYTSSMIGPFSSSLNLVFGGVTGGSTLKIRICASMNANAEIITIDDVEVPEAGVTVGCAAPVLTTSITPVGCNGTNTGAINLGVSAGTPPYTYDWSNDGAENPDNDPQDLSNLVVGTYTVTVTDAASCSATISATVSTAPLITLSTLVLDATCSGSPDGEIDLTVSGGFGPFTFDWSNDGPEFPDNDQQDLLMAIPGTYTVTVTDAANCTKTISATIGLLPSGAYLEQFNTPNKGYLLNNVDDFSAVNWSISGWGGGREIDDYFNASGGVLTGADFDEELCWSSPVIDLNGGTQFSVDLAWATFDDADYINVLYSLDGGGFVQVPNVIGGGAGTIQYPFPSSAQSGSTTVTKTGLSGNTLEIQVCAIMNVQAETITIDNVSVPGSGGTFCPGPTVSLTPTHMSCNGGSNGAVTSTVVDGQTPYTYLWSNGATSPNLTGVMAGTYTLVVTDANMLTASATTTVNQPSAITLTSTQTNVLCNGAATGAIDLSVTGGVPGYSYAWTGGAITQDRSGLTAGTYTVTVTDANSCTKTTSVTISQPSAITPTTTQVNVSCNGGANGSIDLSVNGGVPGYTYLWTGGVTTQDRSGLTAGTYTVTVTDVNSCTKTTSVTITQPSAITPTSTQVNLLCNGDANGSIDLSVNGGVPGYTYLWTGGATTQDRSGLTAGTYTVTITDASGCTKTYAATILQPPVLALSSTQVNVLCNGNATGSIDLTVNGGVSSYTYAWTGGATTQDRSGLTAGTYTVTVTDANNCTATRSVTITEPPALSLSATTINPSNCGVADGSIDLSVSGGAGSYTYDWSNDGAEAPDNDPQDLNNIVVGTYTVTVTDANSCSSTLSKTLTFDDQTPPTITCPADVTIAANGTCAGVLGAYAPATLSDNCTFNPPVTQSPVSGTALNGHNDVETVTLTATDANNNSASCNFLVTLKDVAPPTITCPTNATVNANASCQAQVGSYAPASLADNCNPAPSVTQTPASTTLLTGHNATQTITLTANDGNGNTSTCTLTVTLKDVTAPSITCPANATVNANASCQAQVGAYTATSLSDNCNPSPTVVQSPVSSTILTGHNTVQTVTLTANDGNGNTSTCTLTVTLKDVTAPSITCPANATVNANASCQGQVGSYTATSLSDNCNPSPTVVQSPVSSTTLTGHNTVQTITLTANDGNGNTSTCTLTVTLRDVTPPSLTCPANATVNANASCQGQIGAYTPASLSDNCNPSPTVVQSPASTTLLTGHNSAQTVTFTANDGNGNSATCTSTVTLKDVTAPNITCPANVTVNANASCQGQVGSYSATSLSDNCNPSPTVVQSPVSSTILTGHNTVQTVTLTANDGNGNSANCTLTVTLRDVTPPTITCPANTTINAGPTCSSSLGSYVALTVSDNCNPSPTVVQSPASSTILSGHNDAETVTLTTNDGNGNTANCTFTVTLKDVTAPSITCPANVTIAANASCTGVLGSYTPASLSDNCNANPAVTQSPAAGLSLSGHNDAETVTLTANDGNGNTANCTFTVTLKDVTAPTVTCPANLTLAANSSCSNVVGNYTANSTTDNCNPNPTVVQSPVGSTVLSGHNDVETVTLTANDGNGNTANCTFTVTLKDVTAPTITCPANTTINAGPTCSSTLGSYAALTLSDNCTANPTVTQSPVSSTLLSGHNDAETVTLTANDGNGNTANCTFVVTLKDVTAPSITCPANVTIAANASCAGALGSYTPASLSDNCNANPSVTQSPAAGLPLSGHNDAETVTLTANDGNGNTANCTFTVTLKDVTPPSITCPSNTTLAADANCSGAIGNYTALSVSDNCATNLIISQSPAPGTTLNGHNDVETVVLTANDDNGNTQNCTFTVTLKDLTPPTVVCKPFTAFLNSGGTATITPANVYQSGTDNCGAVTPASVSPSSFNCSNLGANTVVLTANDVNGNSSTCSAVVTVVDNIAPTMICRPVTLFLNAQGLATLTPAQVNNGSFDNCGIVTLNVTPSTFTCAQVGNNTVELTGLDQSSNKGSCFATVTVVDAIVPTALCKNLTVNLPPSGSLTLLPNQLNNGSSDNCSFSMTVIPNVMTCANVGTNIVTLRVTDASGNSASCTSTVIVRDLSAPTALCKNATIFLDQNGQATLTPAQIDNGSTDACGIASRTLSQTQFNCSELAGSPWAVTMTLRDANNNTSSCLAYVTVRDIIPPTAVCENATVYLNQNNQVVVYTAPLADQSTDNCSVWSYTPTLKLYTAANLGANNLSITVKDWSGNAATCVSVVTVLPYNGNNGNDFQTNDDEKQHPLDETTMTLSVYPNPSTGDINLSFELPEDEAFTLRAFDTAGRLVYWQKGHGFRGENALGLTLSGLMPGVYLLDFEAGKQRAQKRVVIQH